VGRLECLAVADAPGTPNCTTRLRGLQIIVTAVDPWRSRTEELGVVADTSLQMDQYQLTRTIPISLELS
jgi:hypothetical protein